MIRRTTFVVSAVIVLTLATAFCFAREPVLDVGAPVYYQVTMHYGGLGPDEQGPPAIDTGMSDPLFRGTAAARLELVGSQLMVRGVYARLGGYVLTDVAEGVHLHHDPAIFHLDTLVAGLMNEGGDEGAFSGSLDLTPQQQLMLFQGRMYMDVHTTAMPEGELRGLVVPARAQAPLLPLPLAAR